jgi:signal transduction histidine kinase
MHLGESLDYETTLAHAARLAIPTLADCCVIEVVDDDPDLCRAVAAHADPEKEARLNELLSRRRSESGTMFIAAKVIEEGRSMIASDVAGVFGSPLSDIGARSVMSSPLSLRGRTIGAITFACSAPGEHYGARDACVAEELARRASVAIDNARLYRGAQEAIKLRDDFISIASHELHTPITSLQLLVQGFKSGLINPSREAQVHMFEIAERQTKRLTALVRELVDVSRIDAGRLDLHLESIDLSTLVQEMLTRYGDSLRRAQCPVTLSAPHPVVGHWDRMRLEQVISNLLGNSIKFGAGHPIEISVDDAFGTARLVLRDSGVGIAPERLPHIFDRFERAASSREYGGLGIGLYVVAEIVRALGGSVRAQSELGHGATFCVELPLAGPTEAMVHEVA